MGEWSIGSAFYPWLSRVTRLFSMATPSPISNHKYANKCSVWEDAFTFSLRLDASEIQVDETIFLLESYIESTMKRQWPWRTVFLKDLEGLEGKIKEVPGCILCSGISYRFLYWNPSSPPPRIHQKELDIFKKVCWSFFDPSLHSLLLGRRNLKSSIVIIRSISPHQKVSSTSLKMEISSQFILFSKSYTCSLFCYNVIFLKVYFIFREMGRGEERERDIDVWLPLVCPTLGTWPAPQACAIDRE